MLLHGFKKNVLALVACSMFGHSQMGIAAQTNNGICDVMPRECSCGKIATCTETCEQVCGDLSIPKFDGNKLRIPYMQMQGAQDAFSVDLRFNPSNMCFTPDVSSIKPVQLPQTTANVELQQFQSSDLFAQFSKNFGISVNEIDFNSTIIKEVNKATKIFSIPINNKSDKTISKMEGNIIVTSTNYSDKYYFNLIFFKTEPTQVYPKNKYPQVVLNSTAYDYTKNALGSLSIIFNGKNYNASFSPLAVDGYSECARKAVSDHQAEIGNAYAEALVNTGDYMAAAHSAQLQSQSFIIRHCGLGPIPQPSFSPQLTSK